MATHHILCVRAGAAAQPVVPVPSLVRGRVRLGRGRRPADEAGGNAPVLRSLSGAGLVVSYADREGIKDTGYGLVLTFENVYTVGLTRYGSENGIFLSLDLANLFRDRLKPQYEAARIMFR